MARRSTISADKNEAKIVSGVYEIKAPYPAKSTQDPVIFRDYFTLNGNGTTRSMKENGSTIPKDFYIKAQPDYDIYITALSFYVGAELSVVDLVEFANLPALTNGCALFYESQKTGLLTISDPIKSNYDMMKMGLFRPGIGTGTASFETQFALSNTSEGYLSTVYMSQIGFDKGGLLLRNGTTDRLVFRIRDNLVQSTLSLQQLDGIAHGYKIKI
jgi:hypothetical protein